MTTPSQTVGPFLSIGLSWANGPDVVPPDADGAVWIRGTLTDGAGEPITDGLVETWQADADGRFDHPGDPRSAVPGFRGFGRCETDEQGAYAIRTVVPGAVPALDGGTQAPHIAVSVFARGLLHRVVTRIYFPEHVDAHSADPVLATIPHDRRRTLIAEKMADGYRFDVRLQGDGETVFFDV